MKTMHSTLGRDYIEKRRTSPFKRKKKKIKRKSDAWKLRTSVYIERLSNFKHRSPTLIIKKFILQSEFFKPTVLTTKFKGL